MNSYALNHGGPEDMRHSYPLHSSNEEFRAAVAEQIGAFESAPLVRLITSGKVELRHYHAILTTVFHQTQSGPYTFAKAAAECSWRHGAAKEYLLQHALEERTHWRWILDDLKSMNYVGPDPSTTFPHPSCEAYISFNERIAERMPVARLAIASVLEGIGAGFGGRYGAILLRTLGLGAEHASFCLSHGETDKAHIEDLYDVINQCTLDAAEWGWMTHAAKVAGQLYRGMYSHDAFA